MTKERIIQIAAILLTALLALAAVFGYDLGVIQPREARYHTEILAALQGSELSAQAVSHFREIEVQSLKAPMPTAMGTATPGIMVDSSGVANLLELRKAATPVYYVDADGNLTLSALEINSTTTVTVTNGLTITPTTSLYILDAAGAVTVTLAACSNNGQHLITYGNDAQTITIADTNILTSSGAALTISQYDLIGWICVSTKWVELFTIANS